MAIFPRFSGPLVRGNSPAETFLRGIALLAVFAGAAYLFWVNTAKNMEIIQSRGSVWDETKTLNKDQRQALIEFAVLFRKEYGMNLKIQVRNSPLELPVEDSKTIFLGINPSTRQVLVDFPPLMRRALGEDYLYKLQNEHFTPYFDSGEWQKGLALALTSIWENLTGAVQPGGTS